MRYLCRVSVLPTVEGGRRPQFGDADNCTSTDAKQCRVSTVLCGLQISCLVKGCKKVSLICRNTEVVDKM